MLRVALAGNPNSGKTSLFNCLTGASQHVGNYPGVTVEIMEGYCEFESERVKVIDLPGTYSLTAYSPDEIVARNYIVEENPDLILNVVDAGNLERNLYLSSQLIELRRPMVIALNMVDLAEKLGVTISAAKLSEQLGIPVVSIQASRNRGIGELKRACMLAIQKQLIPHPIRYTHELAEILPIIENELSENKNLCHGLPPRWIALKLLEDDGPVCKEIKAAANGERIVWALNEAKKRLRAHSDEDSATAVVEARYGFAGGAAREVTTSADSVKKQVTDRIDNIVCNRFLGPILLCVMVYLLFFFVFQLAEVQQWIPLFNGAWVSPTGLFDFVFRHLNESAARVIEIDWLRSLICDGIISGVGGVLMFVPLIFFMFLFISFLEDSGYIARVAFIMDRLLRVFGLQGNSILALIVSGGLGAGGCAVPGVMAARTLREERDRIVTILVVPFMNCGAKMPVYAMLIAAFFARAQGAMMFLLWMLSWCFALFSAWALRKAVVRGEQTPFVMELPVYHLPTFKGVLFDTWHRTWLYIRKAATVILAINVLLWMLMYYPRQSSEVYDEQREKAEHSLQTELRRTEYAALAALDEFRATMVSSQAAVRAKAYELLQQLETAMEEEPDSKGVVAYRQYLNELQSIDRLQAQQQLKNSFAGRIGMALLPVSKLAGFDWRENIALIGGFAAKEVVLGTLSTAYAMGDGGGAEDRVNSIAGTLQTHPDWNALRAFALLIFVMAYAPCAATIAAIYKETGSWKWPAFSLVYSTGIAFVVATVVYQVGRFFLLS